MLLTDNSAGILLADSGTGRDRARAVDGAVDRGKDQVDKGKGLIKIIRHIQIKSSQVFYSCIYVRIHNLIIFDKRNNFSISL